MEKFTLSWNGSRENLSIMICMGSDELVIESSSLLTVTFFTFITTLSYRILILLFSSVMVDNSKYT